MALLAYLGSTTVSTIRWEWQLLVCADITEQLFWVSFSDRRHQPYSYRTVVVLKESQ